MDGGGWLGGGQCAYPGVTDLTLLSYTERLVQARMINSGRAPARPHRGRTRLGHQCQSILCKSGPSRAATTTAPATERML